VPRSQAMVAAATQRPVAENALSDKAGDPAWTSIPSWSLIPTGDKNIPPEAQRFMSKRAHAHITEVPGASHAVLVSQPGRTTDVILQAAESVR
jgi:pimeloyl-ACP methyl ester carboxylesterase